MITVVGATGQTGRLVVEKLKKQGEKVRALVRNAKKAQDLNLEADEIVVCDISHDSLDNKLAGSTAIICTIGAGIEGDPDKVDNQATIKLIEAAKHQNVKRFVLMTSLGTPNPEVMPDMLKPYLYAKQKAEAFLRESGLDFTIVRPGGLTNENGTGKVSTKIGQNHTISRKNVAEVLVFLSDKTNMSGLEFDIVDGDDLIDEILDDLSEEEFIHA